ncbi:MAG: ATP-grasp domain-containing protein [Deltaproteobacteria bacterium]|nr:ATP-grasp domain-containing protein [Deltaproteobacteria bacterium]
MKPLRVWFNKSYSGTFHLIASLKAGDPSIQVFASHTSDSAMLLPADTRFAEQKALVGAAYLDWVQSMAREHEIDVLVAGKEAARIAEARPQLEAAGTRVLVAGSADTMRLLHDKARFYDTFDSSIAPVLRFRSVTSLPEFDAACEELSAGGAPICMKPAMGVFGHGFRLLIAKDSLDRVLRGDQVSMSLDHARTLLERHERFQPMLVMRYAEGSERSVDCLGHRGELLRAVVRRKQGGTSIQLIEDNPGAVEIARKITRSYSLTGIFNVQLKDAGGAPHILEVNPRASGGIHVSMEAGLNFPLWAVRLIAERASPDDVPWPRTGLHVSQISQAVVLAS